MDHSFNICNYNLVVHIRHFYFNVTLNDLTLKVMNLWTTGKSRAESVVHIHHFHPNVILTVHECL